MKRDYSDYINDVLTEVSNIEVFTEGMSYPDFVRDKKTTYAVIRGIEVIGEAVKKLPKDLKDIHPDVPWKRIAGMRDKLIHEYFGVDTEIVWKTVKEDIPYLKSLFQKIKEGERDG
jgi:uncharacterized protein with HEPN domain